MGMWKTDVKDGTPTAVKHAFILETNKKLIALSYNHPVFAIKNIGEKYVASSWCFLMQTQDDFKLNMKNYIQFNLWKQIYFLDEVVMLPASGIYVYTYVYTHIFFYLGVLKLQKFEIHFLMSSLLKRYK